MTTGRSDASDTVGVASSTTAAFTAAVARQRLSRPAMDVASASRMLLSLVFAAHADAAAWVGGICSATIFLHSGFFLLLELNLRMLFGACNDATFILNQIGS